MMAYAQLKGTEDAGKGPIDKNEPADKSSNERPTKRFLWAAITATGCCMLPVGIIIGIIIGVAYCSSEEPELGPPSSPPAYAETDEGDGCSAYDARGARLFEGFVEYEDEGDIDEAAVLALDNPFARTFVNYTCVMTGGTGDPCDVHKAETWFDLLFRSLRLDQLMLTWINDIALFSFAQLGGIPRPKPNDWVGVAFWAAWMLTQVAQYVVILFSLILEVVMYMGVRARLAPCLVVVSGVTLFDEFMQTTLIVMPAILGKLMLLYLYGYLISLGMLVWEGRAMTKAAFTEAVSKTRGRKLESPFPITTVQYALARFVFMAACIGTVSENAGPVGVVGGWVLSIAVVSKCTAAGDSSIAIAATAPALVNVLGLSDALGAQLERVTPSHVLLVLLALPVATSLYFVPLGLAFIWFVKLSLVGAHAVLEAIDDTYRNSALPAPAVLPAPEPSLSASAPDERDAKIARLEKQLQEKEKQLQDDATGPASKWKRSHLPACLPEHMLGWLDSLAAPTKTAVGWMAPVGRLKLASGMAMIKQGLDYTETSVSTLAGGVASLLAAFALSSMIAYGSWADAAAQAVHAGAIEATAANGTMVDAVKANTWMLWSAAILPAALFGVDYRKKFNLLTHRAYKRGLFLTLSGQGMIDTLLSLYALPLVTILLLGACITFLDSARLVRIFACYSNSLSALLTLHVDWSTLVPPFDDVLAVLKDPVAALQETVEAIASITRYLEINPEYFAENIVALGVLNIALNVLKVLATYGRKAFAIFDALRLLLFGGSRKKDDDSTVQVHECVADVQHAQGDAALDLVCQKCGTNYEDALEATELEWKGKGLTAADALGVAHLVRVSAVLKNLNVAYNSSIRGEAAQQLAAAALDSKSLEVLSEVPIKELREDKLFELNLKSKGLRQTEAIVIAALVEGSAVLYSLNLYENNIGPEGAKAIAEALGSGKAVLTDLNLEMNEIGAEGAKAIAEALGSGKAVLTECCLIRNNLDVESATMLAKIGTEKHIMLSGMKRDQTRASFRDQSLRSADAILIASDLPFMAVLNMLDLKFNSLDNEGKQVVRDAVKKRDGFELLL